MKDGFLKVAACDLRVKVADVFYNTQQIKEAITEADEKSVNVLVLPELCVTGYTCADLFFSEKLLTSAKKALLDIVRFTEGKYCVVIVSLPLAVRGKLYNCAAVVCNGCILGVVPKKNLPNYGGYYEKRCFSALDDGQDGLYIELGGASVPFGNDLVFENKEMENYTFGVEICEDLWAPVSPAQRLCLGGAMMMFNASASDETVGRTESRTLFVQSTSARLLCGYVFASAGYTESTQDVVFSGHHIIAEMGTILAQKPSLKDAGMIVSEIDVNRLASIRRKNTTFVLDKYDEVRHITFSQEIKETSLTRKFAKNPFVPSDENKRNKRIETVLNIQSYGLARRIEHTNAGCCVIGISGGLDSTLALLVASRAMDILKRPRTDILAITMPCFGTTKRTHSNSEKLCKILGVSFKEINIKKAVSQHFEDIGQDKDTFDVTFENSQARERTQVLMDVANKSGGLVVGTGDLSELALGWATYNGDHMSMYGVNASVPKTLVRHTVRYEAERAGGELCEVLMDILDTPVSPELLPVDKDGNIAQKTEDLVGPYALHDFFLYHMIKYGSSPKKIFRLACLVFEDEYSEEVIKHWLKTFVRRFFAQQFKRSCMPDGPKIGPVNLSPRGDWRMPTDACSRLWINEAESL